MNLPFHCVVLHIKKEDMKINNLTAEGKNAQTIFRRCRPTLAPNQLLKRVKHY